MRSDRPKPLHLLCGRPMVLLRARRPAAAASSTGPSSSSATAPSGSPRSCRTRAPTCCIEFVEQHGAAGHRRRRQRRPHRLPRRRRSTTTTATCSCCPATRRCCGRPPSPRSWPRTGQPDAACTVLTARVADPTGYGRVVRGEDDRVMRIVEQRDATADERAIDEVNTSIYCFRRSLLAPALRRLSPENAQGEYYLTDVVEVLAEAGYPVASRRRRRRRRDPGRQRPGPAGRGRGRAAAPHQRRAGCGRASRCSTPSAPTSTPPSSSAPTSRSSPGTMLQGRTRGRRPVPRSAPTPGWSTAWSAPSAVVEQTVGRDAEIGDGAVVGPYAVLEPGAADPCGSADRAVLHCDRLTTTEGRAVKIIEVPTTKKLLHWSRAGRTSRWPRRSPTTSASSWASPTWPSSPTARSTAASASASAAPTSSSSRPTPHSTGCRSTTRSWSS